MFETAAALTPLVIKGKKIRLPIIQGGMGVGVSLSPLASAVAREGGLGIISSACLDRLMTKRTGKKHNTYEGAYEEVSLAKSSSGFAGINIMGALVRDFNDSVKGSLDAGADAIISGAGLPLTLPAIQPPKDTALIPIVSSARALDIICKKWEKLGYRPDAVVLEGPLAGGHLGFKIDQIDADEHRLENLFPPVKDMAMKYGNFPVIVAGGIYTHDDIVRFLKMGADGVQMGTRFLATEECSATAEYKRAVLEAKEEDIVVAHDPGSPCGLPFRVIKQSPMYLSAQQKKRQPKCDKGYVLLKDKEGKFTICPAKVSNEHHFCICNGLLSSAGYNSDVEEPLYTVGTNASRVDRIVPVKTLMEELAGKVLTPAS
ncbi:MAG TPA: nitronate monooxygenase family protein [Thermodesulfovibrionales bacterium]|nr:nitronate monooxygenase family protein [Thermodesulfovibrionales bacterium]